MPDRPTAPLDFSGGLDPRFLHRVHLASAVVSGLGGLIAMSAVSLSWGLGFAAFGLWATTNTWALSRVLRPVVVAQRSTVDLIGALALKIPILYGLGFLLLWKGGFPPVSIVCGVSVPLAVILLKMIGRVVAPKVAMPTSPKSR